MNAKELNYLKSLGACSDAIRWGEQFKTINEAWQVCQRGDWMMWLVKHNNPTKELSVTLAIRFAERVLPIYEQRYPNDQRPRKAIEAAKTWLGNQTDAAAAADAADAAAAAAAYTAAADAADAAYAAADAADAAYAAADAAYAAYAADAAYAAAAAAAAAAAEKKINADIIRELIPEFYIETIRGETK